MERRGDRVLVTGAREAPARRVPLPAAPGSVQIVGGGAAGFAAADLLRREGYAGPAGPVGQGGHLVKNRSFDPGERGAFTFG